MGNKKLFHIDERYVSVNLTLSIILYVMVVPFCIYLAIDNYIRGNVVVARYAMFCSIMTAVAIVNFSICKFGKKRRRWLMHVAINIQCLVFWSTFFFFLFTGGTEGSSIFLFFLAVPVVFFFFNLAYGIYFNLVFFLIMVIYMNTPLRYLGYQFPEVYYSRLPMMYLANIVMCAIAQYEIVKAKIKQDNALEEAKRASEAKTDFLANTSHEIRTPINAVLGMNEMIIRESAKAERIHDENPEVYHEAFKKIRQYSGNVDSAGNNLLAIINDILDFTKIEEGKMDIVNVNYQLSSVINDVSNMIYFKAKEKNLKFVTEVNENLPDNLYGDVVRVRQVIVNILNNAVKYTDSGKVTFNVDGRKGADTPDGKTTMDLVINVSDTGIGISEENIKKLFNKFERVDLERNSTKEGTGLGLAITKMLLDMMDGEISVKSEYGVGSTFTVVIPQVVVSEEPVGNFKEKFENSLGEKKIYHESFRAPSAKVLIVDDTKMNLIVVTEFLKETQVAIDTASGGREAVKLALANKYDVILMDQRMPVMDGEETLRAIKRHKKGPNIETPIICLTADAVVGARERYLSKGFNDYLTKPIDSTYLEMMLKKYIPEEKLETISEEEKALNRAVDQSADDDHSTIKILDRSGIVTSKGLENCARDERFYISMLIEYSKGHDEKIADLNRFLEEGDLHNYEILIHSLKSTSATIGAVIPSKTALDLENAAKNGDLDFIIANHDRFISEYNAVLEAIGIALPAEDGKGEFEIGENGAMEFSPDSE